MTTRHRLQTSHQIRPGHWITVRRSFTGWEVLEIQGCTTTTHHTCSGRVEAELIAEATAATRNPTGATR
jgi:hypothetical protein